MAYLTARDALTTSLLRVTCEERVDAPEVVLQGLYAVFSLHDPERFLGLVSSDDVVGKSNRVFADLVTHPLPCVVAEDSPLEEILTCMDVSGCWFLPVLDDQSRFVGAVTRSSIQQVMLDSHRRLLEQNRWLTRQMFALQEKERRDLALELHDQLGQHIAVMLADLERLAGFARGNDSLMKQVHALEKGLDYMHQEVYRIMHRLRPLLLDQLGLDDALRDLIGEFSKRHHDIAFSLQISGKFSGLPEQIAITLFRVVQEGLTNVVRHSGAKSVRVCLCRLSPCRHPVCKSWFQSMSCLEDEVHLMICDNGSGLLSLQEGFGMLGMRERLESNGGAFWVDNHPGQGMCLIAKLPVATSVDDE